MSVSITNTRKIRGFTLTEAAIVLGIVGLILGAIWTAASAVYQNQRVNSTSDSILKIVQAVRSLYSTQASMGSAAGDLTTAMISAGVIPSDMVVNSTTTTNAWNGRVFVGASTSSQNGMVIEISNVPSDACIKMISTLGGNIRDSGLALATAVANGSTYTGAATASALATNIDVATATTRCTAVASPVKVQLGFLLK